MKNRNIKSTVLIALFSILSYTANAQNKALKVGTNPTIKEGSAAFEVESADKGLLVPRVALNSTVDVTTIASPANALTVFNTATSAAGSNSVIPGYYYYSKDLITPANSKWIKLFDANTPKSSWDLTGNAGTTPATNFLGTTDAQDLVFRTNNLERLRVTKTGRLDFSNTSGSSSNTFIEGGNETTTGIYNTIIGFEAANNITTGKFNVAVGSSSLNALTTGLNNIVIGVGSANSISSAKSNIAIGNNIMPSLTTGDENIFIGNNSAFQATSGGQNTFLGFLSGTSFKTGFNNTMSGSGSGSSFISGNSNTFFGTGSGGNLTTGDLNIAIGRSTNLSSATGSNQLNLGNVIFGTGLTGTVVAPAGFIGIDISAPTNTLHVKATANPVRFEGLLPSAVATENVVVTDATGVLKTVTSASLKGGDYSATEQLTSKFWIDGTTPVYWKSIAYTLASNSTTFDLSSSFTANQLKRILSIRVINLTNNGISTEIGSYDLATNKFVMGSGNSFFNMHNAGNYEIIIEYLK